MYPIFIFFLNPVRGHLVFLLCLLPPTPWMDACMTRPLSSEALGGLTHYYSIPHGRRMEMDGWMDGWIRRSWCVWMHSINKKNRRERWWSLTGTKYHNKTLFFLPSYLFSSLGEQHGGEHVFLFVMDTIGVGWGGIVPLVLLPCAP